MGRLHGSTLLARRPSSAWALALLLLGGAVRCLVGAAVRTAPVPHQAALVAVGLVCLTASVGVFIAGARCSRALMHALLLLVTVATSLLVALSPDRADVVLSAFAYPWCGLYAAYFISRRGAYGYAGLAAVGFAVGIRVAGLPDLMAAWVTVTATVFAVTAATSALVATLRRQSETDALTGVANRAGFERLAALALASATRTGRPAALVLCDVDGLKSVNDSFGHAAGDALLSGIAAAWHSVARASDVLARLGGDEFAILMPDTDRAGAEAAVRRLRDATDVPFSAGVATWVAGDSLETMLSRADEAMYECKTRSGRRVTSVPARRGPVAPSLADQAAAYIG